METIDPTASQDGVAAVSYKDPAAPALFTDSLHRTGFGVVRDHPIPQALVEEIYAEWLDFFTARPSTNILVSAKHDGFFSAASRRPPRATPSATSRNTSTSIPGGAIRPRCPMRRGAITISPATSPPELLPWVEDNTPAEVRAKFSMPLPEMIRGPRHAAAHPALSAADRRGRSRCGAGGRA